jgi:hypothetical protein
VPAARENEISLLFAGMLEELEHSRANAEVKLKGLVQTHREQRTEFDEGLQRVIEKVSAGINLMLDALGEDYAVIPDISKDAYALTACKRERAHIQIAYSRACIEIDSFLAGHGVIDLPSDQQTATGSLNSVMIAVMGVSVKFRRDLRRIFCEPLGRERLQRDFARYFELSADRQDLVREISRNGSIMSDIEKAEQVLNALRARQ